MIELSVIIVAFNLFGFMALFCPGLLTSLRSTWIFFVISGSLFPLAAANTSMGLLLFAAGRIVGGFGAGAATVLVPLYLGRIAPLKLRGAIGNLHQVRNEHLDIHDIQCSKVSRDSRSFIQRMEGQKKLEFQMDFERTFFLTRIFKDRESSCVLRRWPSFWDYWWHSAQAWHQEIGQWEVGESVEHPTT